MNNCNYYLFNDLYKSVDSNLSDINKTLANVLEIVNYIASTKADKEHTHEIAEVNGLQEILDKKTDAGHTHETTDVNGLKEELNKKSDLIHAHMIADIYDLQDELNNKASLTHTHAIKDIDELEDKINLKADSVHTHTTADIPTFESSVTSLATNIVNDAIKNDLYTLLLDKTDNTLTATLVGLLGAESNRNISFYRVVDDNLSLLGTAITDTDGKAVFDISGFDGNFKASIGNVSSAII